MEIIVQENIKRALNESVLIRWSALLMISLTMFASYYFYDIFSAIKSTLQAEVGLSNADYGAWYGAYSLFNAFGMALIGGIILDKWGIRRTGIIFISFVFLGTFMTAYGASVTFSSGGPFYGSFSSKLFLGNLSPALKMMITGRALFGLGAETFYVVLNKIIAKWFKGHELALAFAVNVSFGRLGTAAVMILSPRIVASAPVWDMAGWLGAMLTLISVICFFAYIFFDVKFDRSVKEVSLESDDSVEFRLRHVLELFKNRSFIYITLLCVTFYSAVFPFLGYTPDFLMNKFGFSEKASGLVTTILPFGTIVFTPIFGWFCDKKGKSASVMILGSFILILVFLTFTFTTLMPYIPLFFLGVAF
jgi:nitrate/nitrite transporter NarK